MALAFPLTAAAFLDMLPVQDVQFSLNRPLQATGLGSGEILTTERGPAYWTGSLSLAPMPKRQAAQVQALLSWLERPDASFYVHKLHQAGPAADPLGAALASAVPVLEAVNGADPHKVKLGGLPQGYELQPGDFLAFDYNPGTGTRRALHQVVSGGSATAASGHSGHTQPGFMQVVPHIRPGLAAGTAVELVKPAALAGLVPGSVSSGITRGSVTSGIAFDFRQKLRG